MRFIRKARINVNHPGERKMRIITALVSAVIFMSVSVFGGEIKLPSGCRAAKGAKAGAGSYADKIVHEKTGIELVLIPAGTFMMGVNKVTIREAFYIGKTEVTNAQYRRFVNATGYDGKGDTDPAYDLYLRHWRGKSLMSKEDNYPIVWVSWKNAKAFCKWSELALPSEAQWEYACRAGTTTYYYFGNDKKDFDKYGWVTTNSGNLTHLVAEKLPNRWGLYDMLGNVYEWVEDDYTSSESKIRDAASTNESPRLEGKMTRVFRGGSWSSGTPIAGSGARGRLHGAPGNASADIGFRLILPLEK